MKVLGNAGGWTYEDFQDVIESIGVVMGSEASLDKPAFSSVMFAADGTIVLSFCDGDLGVLRSPTSSLTMEHTDEDDLS